MTLDYSSIISDESTLIRRAFQRERGSKVPWSDRWTVATVARHVASIHYVVGEIIKGRPDADFGLFNDLEVPSKDDPEFLEWSRTGTASLLDQLSSAPADDECWSWYEHGRSVGWWARRMAHETVVYRSDVDLAQGQTFSVDSEIAADGVDENLDVFVGAARATNDSPSGPTIGFECTDRDDRWWLDLSVRGDRTVSREARPASLRIRGTAEQLLLFVWGRPPSSGIPGVIVSGETPVLDRWAELIPPM